MQILQICRSLRQKCHIVQDRFFESDFDREIKRLEDTAKQIEGKETTEHTE